MVLDERCVLYIIRYCFIHILALIMVDLSLDLVVIEMSSDKTRFSIVDSQTKLILLASIMSFI